MCQVYHFNAKTNQHVREPIQKSSLLSVELANGTIKNSTIKVTEYKNTEELKENLNKFLIHYNTNRKHGGLKKELKVTTPCEAVDSWLDVEPKLFKISPDAFYAIALNGTVQRGET